MPALSESLRAARVVASARLKTMPIVFLPIARLRQNEKRTLVRRDSDIVIEGYWRCANHYATNAFIVAQPRPVHVAHHFHAPAQLMLAVRWNVPALLLIREPIAAVASATVFLQNEDPIPFLKFYNIFHAALVPYGSQLVISDFARTTTDFRSVISEINQRYHRDYALYQGTLEEERRVNDLIRREHQSNIRGGVATLPLPSEEKDRLKEKVVQRLLAPECASLLSQAQLYYEHFSSPRV